MTGCAVIHDAGVRKHRGHETGDDVTAVAILRGRQVGCRLQQIGPCGHEAQVVTTITTPGDAGVNISQECCRGKRCG